MSQPVTLEFLREQMDRFLVQLQETHDGIREIREIMQRCIAKARDVQELLDECKSILDEGLCA
jgi:hypothetical protein